MTVSRLVAMLTLAVLPHAAIAGGFVLLPLVEPLRVFGTQNQNSDPLKLTDGPIIGSDAFGNLYAPPANLTQLGMTTSSILYLGNTVGTLYDFVFRDTDDFLVFGSRVALGNNDFEINDFFRSGYTGFPVSAAWSFGSDRDLRMYSAARTTTPLLGGPDVFSPDVVNMRSDINTSEGNPRSGYYFLKTNATVYRTLPGAITLRQSGEEGQPPTNIVFSGFAPTTSGGGGGPPNQATVPLPGWALVLLAVVLAGQGVRRRLG